MLMTRLIAIVLILGGIAALTYGGFTYTKNTEVIKVGSVALSIKEKRTVDLPVWAGIAAVVAGVALLAFATKR
ncbi:MAG: hypothetical protein M3N23_08170 [Pseudomonadota bacterium]|nr:hypothetical protein [Pseudomonadota bacterium]